METCMNHFVKTSKTSKNFKNYKNPNFRTDSGTKIYQIFKLKFGLVPQKRVSSNNLRKSGAPFDLSLTSGSLLRNDIIVNSVFSPESAHTHSTVFISAHLCFTCSILKLKSQITWYSSCHFIPLVQVLYILCSSSLIYNTSKSERYNLRWTTKQDHPW